ncbi:hypothetical protein JOQ06_006627 [Pogonophryne albipinna]|uniref:Immunoglobulin domain-containing protein n=1 Tax=Pogonophryne albipinna TaxID=1090488 RepID=A0AAD6FHI4_9TELE|nr:hypothetical protein JOQ06_006627 [Pogonophryne albipinna]
MKVCHTLICFFFLFSLQDGSTGLVSAQLSVYSGIEGENVTVECSFPSYGIRTFFCKEPCERKYILIETTNASAQRGRYSIDYKDGGFFVTITQLNKSDSGRYLCAAGTSLTRNSYKDIEITVVDGYVLYVSIDQLTQSDSGWYRCGLGRPDSKDPYQRFRLIVTDALTTSTPSSSVPSASTETSNQSESSTSLPASPKTTEQRETSTSEGVVLYVRLTLVVLVIVSSLSVLVFCRKRTCKAKKPPVETQYDFVTETDRVYDDIVEAGRSRSPPVEISSVYTHARYTRPNGDETEDY